MKKINESFACIHCKRTIPPADKTCRNHCPHCFASLHVDGDIPGDRNTTCQSKMFPVDYEMKNSDIKILFQCIQCGKKHRNKRATDDAVAVLDEIIKTYKKLF